MTHIVDDNCEDCQRREGHISDMIYGAMIERGWVEFKTECLHQEIDQIAMEDLRTVWFAATARMMSVLEDLMTFHEDDEIYLTHIAEELREFEDEQAAQ